MPIEARFSIVIGIILSPLLLAPAFSQEPLTLALTGDSIITRKLSVYDEPQFLEMIELVRGADAAFTNVEMLFHDYEFYPMASSGGTYMRAQPELAKELAWAGFDLASLANNHAGDYGPPAMLMTEKVVREAGITAAGVGRSLSEAREAKFLETANGRIALISVSSTFPSHAIASASRDDVPARPGLNPLRHRVIYQVSQEQIDAVKSLMQELGMSPSDASDSERFLRSDFVAGTETYVVTEPDPRDLDQIGVVVRNASRQADYTIVTIHAHEGDTRFVPADFVEVFARAMIDEGADLFIGHGPHALRAIEMYKGRPIFYSLGDFMFQNETLQRLPLENYDRYGLGEDSGLADFNDARYENDTTGFPVIPEIWESVIAVPVFEGEEVIEIALHPITLNQQGPRTVRGRPMFAGPELGRKILADLERLSEPYGTRIDVVDGVGFVRLPSATTN